MNFEIIYFQNLWVFFKLSKRKRTDESQKMDVLVRGIMYV